MIFIGCMPFKIGWVFLNSSSIFTTCHLPLRMHIAYSMIEKEKILEKDEVQILSTRHIISN